MSSRCWDPILPALVKDGLRVISIDHRGCGQSDKDFSDLSINSIATDVVNVVKQLGIKRVLLNGWSLGAAVVVSAASQLGSVCSGVVLTGGATPIYTQKPDLPFGGTVEDVMGTVAAYESDRVNFLQGLSQIVCVKEVGADVENWFKEMFLQASPLAGATLGELAYLDQRKALLALNTPILSVFGSSDGFVAPDICRWVGEHHPHAVAVELPGVGHAPFVEEREAYLAALLEFVGANI
jgi:pimeloyl-[acyl-carrier protein] methyl ester esterase